MMGEPLTTERLAELRDWAEKARRHGSSAFVPLSPARLLALLDTIDAQAAAIAEAAQVMREVSNELHFAAPTAFALVRARLCDAADRLVSGQESQP